MAIKKPHSSSLRKQRLSQPGKYYFLTTSVAGRRKIFTVRNHSIIVLDTIRWLHTSGCFNVDATVVMPDHLHLVGQLQISTLTRVMHSLKSYSARCLARIGVQTPVWQDGYYDHGLRDDEDYKVKVQYVIENPIRAGLVQRAEDYPYVILPGWWRNMAG